MGLLKDTSCCKLIKYSQALFQVVPTNGLKDLQLFSSVFFHHNNESDLKIM